MGEKAERMNEKHKCIMCEVQISLFRAFCSKDCEEKFFRNYPDEKGGDKK